VIEVLRLDRPASRNAMDTALLRWLVGALERLASNEDLRAVVISTTSVSALSAGADVAEELDAVGGVARMELFTRLYAAVEAVPVPVVCVCVGNCVGAGAELAAGCDLRVGGTNLKLSWAGARFGVPVGPARLPPLIGLSRAKEWILSGRVIGGEEALAAGFLHDLVEPEQAEARALERAEALAAQAGGRVLKQMFRSLEQSADRVAYENGLLMEFQRGGIGLPRR
jgi:enoyl-CoA hydratase/carnithine racemase